MNLLLAISSGILTALAFPKFNISILAFIAPSLLFISLKSSKSTRSSGFLGFIFGIFFFGTNLFWINTLFAYVGYFAYLGYITIVIFQSIFTSILCYLIKRLKSSLSIVAAILWVVFEIIRNIGPFGFSAGTLAYSQAGFLPFIQISSFSTAYGISFLIILINTGIARAVIKKKFGLISSATILTIISLFYGTARLDQAHDYGRFIEISLIQGNVPQEKKLSVIYNQDIFDNYKTLTLKSKSSLPKIIIWPETTIFSYLMADKKFLPQIKKLANDCNSYFIVGSPYLDTKNQNIYNSALCFSPKGTLIGRYDKEHLVPFGEYLPFRPLLFPFLRNTDFFYNDFFPGQMKDPIDISGTRIGMLVCFESTFPWIVKKKNCDFIITITNDAWFKNSSAAYEHLNQGIFRAIENDKYFIQCGNTGISAIIDPRGRIIKKLDLNTRGYLTFKVPLS